jgi:hypothetical protein
MRTLKNREAELSPTRTRGMASVPWAMPGATGMNGVSNRFRNSVDSQQQSG